MNCQYCTQEYAVPSAEQDSCPGCAINGACEDCGEAPATGDGHKPFYCQSCEERWVDNYSGPNEPSQSVSISELSDRAYRDRAELRRR